MDTSEFSGNVDQQLGEILSCPQCGNQTISTTQVLEKFPYGEQPVMLEAVVPVRKCQKCLFEFLDDEAELAHNIAICKHLNVLTPERIRGIREKYALDRSEFAALTGIGEATIARWERGDFVQSAANARYLFLMTFPENIARLDGYEKFCSGKVHIDHQAPRFQELRVTDKKSAEAKEFKLRRTG
jgi:putative zinc finger/helix-turn-helix YgiT family protein